MTRVQTFVTGVNGGQKKPILSVTAVLSLCVTWSNPMAQKLIPVLAAAAASALFFRPALADGPGITNGANAVPQNGWALPVPPTGWGGMPPTGSSAMQGDNHDQGGHVDHGDHHHHQGPVIVTWPYYYSAGSTATSTQPIVINVQPQQPAPQPAGPPPPVPGVDTHPTVEQTPSGIEIVRGPGST